MIKPLAKSILIPLGLTAAASAADAEIHKKSWGLVVVILPALLRAIRKY